MKNPKTVMKTINVSYDVQKGNREQTMEHPAIPTLHTESALTHLCRLVKPPANKRPTVLVIPGKIRKNSA